jgi:hypothetical protein
MLEAERVNKPAHRDLLHQAGEEIQALWGQAGGFGEMGGKGMADEFHDAIAGHKR